MERLLPTILFNVENDREELQEVQPTEGPLPLYSVEEVRKQLEKLGLNKACGPDHLPIEAVKILASYSVHGPPHRNHEHSDARRNAEKLENK